VRDYLTVLGRLPQPGTQDAPLNGGTYRHRLAELFRQSGTTMSPGKREERQEKWEARPDEEKSFYGQAFKKGIRDPAMRSDAARAIRAGRQQLDPRNQAE